MPSHPRPSESTPGFFAFDDFELDLQAFELRRDGIPLALEPQVIEVLSLLIENAGRVVSKDELFDRVWPNRFISEAALNSRIKSARKALGDSGQRQQYIKTIHGRGYRFLGSVEERRPGVVIPFPVGPAPVARTPAPATRFIGRTAEFAALQALAGREECRLVTISGPGGAGKTRMLLELLRSQPADAAVRFVSFEHTDPGGLAAALACGVGAQSGSGLPEDQILRALRSHDVCLYLDNLELLVDEARDLFPRLLDECPGLRIVCTSRAVLNIQSEWLLRLDGMQPEEATELFAERSAHARAGRPFAADDESVAAICELTGQLPLAVELAAGLTAYLEPRELLAHVRRDAAVLSSNLHDIPERHRNLVSLFDQSCERLTPMDRDALMACAVFAGGFDARAAAAVAGCELASLFRLVDSSLLQVSDGRFAMHPLLRQLVLSRSGAATDRLRVGHGEYFMAVLADAAPHLEGPAQLDALDALGADFANVSAAWRWAAANRRVDLLVAARRGLVAYLMRGHYAEGEVLARLGAEVARQSEEPAVLAALLVNEAWFLLRMGRVGEASEALTEALGITRRTDLPWTAGYGADARIAAAMFRVGAGDYPRALAYATQSRERALAAGDRTGAAFACWIAGMALLRQAQLTCDESGGTVRYAPAPGDIHVRESARYVDEARALLPEGEHYLTAAVLVEAGLQCEYAGLHAAARAHFRRSYSLRSALGDVRGMGTARVYLADVLLNDGRAVESEVLLDEAEAHFRRLGDSSGMAEITRVRGLARLALGDLPGARTALTDSLRRSVDLGFANNIAGLMRTFGEIAAIEGDLPRAAEILRAVHGDPSTTPASVARAEAALCRLELRGIRPPEAVPVTRELAAQVLRQADVGHPADSAATTV